MPRNKPYPSPAHAPLGEGMARKAARELREAPIRREEQAGLRSPVRSIVDLPGDQKAFSPTRTVADREQAIRRAREGQAEALRRRDQALKGTK